MTDPLVLWSTIVGFLMPPVLAVIMQTHWRPEVKGIVAFVACLAAATGTVTLQGHLHDGTALTTSFLLIFAGAIATYRLYWRPTGIVPMIERATDTQTARAGNRLAHWRPSPLRLSGALRRVKDCPGGNPEDTRRS